jgi:hypothetical protein
MSAWCAARYFLELGEVKKAIRTPTVTTIGPMDVYE